MSATPVELLGGLRRLVLHLGLRLQNGQPRGARTGEVVREGSSAFSGAPREFDQLLELLLGLRAPFILVLSEQLGALQLLNCVAEK